ncbi:MAG: hypothetical protein U5L09_12465 [Bacteroidales bacterium]|nr:hypothetical protein [Bacteroidales bacterium]
MEAIQSMISLVEKPYQITPAPTPEDDHDVVVSTERAGDFKKWLDEIE